MVNLANMSYKFVTAAKLSALWVGTAGVQGYCGIMLVMLILLESEGHF